MHNNEHGIGSGTKVVGSKVYSLSVKPGSQALRGYYNNLDEDDGSDTDEENPQADDSTTSDGSSQGSSDKMDDPVVWFRNGGRRPRLSTSAMRSMDSVVAQVVRNVRAAGYGEALCLEIRDHFATLPSRYPFCLFATSPQIHNTAGCGIINLSRLVPSNSRAPSTNSPCWLNHCSIVAFHQFNPLRNLLSTIHS